MIVVTGGSRGIGAATAVLLAQRGEDVAVGYRFRRADADLVVAQCRELGVGAEAVECDVAVEGQVERLFDEATDSLGPLTGLVTSAGIVAPMMPLAQMTAQRMQRMIDVNVMGTLLCAREGVLRMSTEYGGAGGAIVLVSSIGAVLGSPGSYVDYAASKGAVDTLTVGLAREVADQGIRVNGVRPGIIRTEIHGDSGDIDRPDKVGPSIPVGRAGEPEEVAAAIAWLLSDDASYCTGAILDVTGGR